jgi:TusA-related sulfurtransferase
VTPARPPDEATAAQRLDNRGVPCALGLLRVRDTMSDLSAGDTLVIESRDRFAPIEIPLWAERAGHRVLAVEATGRWPRRAHRITIRKRSPGAAAPRSH